MNETKLRVGIIGAGMYALRFHSPQLRDTGRVEVVAICRRSQKQLAIAQETLGVTEGYTDWREMIERADLDAVLVSTPHYYHAEPALGALERGLHVLVDKPMALNSQDAWAMVEAAKRSERVLMVTYETRAQGSWQSLKRQLQDGIIGQVRQINLSVTTYRRWFWQADIPPDVMEVARSSLDVPDEFYEGWHD